MEKDVQGILPEAELHCFNDPDQALAFAETEGCDVLLTEIELWSEKLGGIRLAREITKRNPRVQIIFVTVCGEYEVARELDDLHVSGFIPKPWMPEKLAAAFRNLRDPKKPTHNHVNHAADAAQNKEEKTMKHRSKKLWSILLSLALMLSLLPSMSLTANADNTEELLTTITATGQEQASYAPANVATVSFSYTAEGSSAYLANWGWWGYGWTATVAPANGYTITKCVFYDDKDRTATDSEAPFVVETTEEDKTPKVNGTPILANQSKGITKIEVYGYATPAAGEDTTSYTLTIPSTLSVANSGWNATDGISATGTLESGKKLTVTASSANNWALKADGVADGIGYTLTTAEGGSQTISWTFDSLSNTATTKPMGIIVENYDNKPAGTYTDTVTFTAKVENAVTTRTVTWNKSDITGRYGESFTKDGITITAGMIDFQDTNFMDGGTFTTASGKFTKIVVTARNTVSGTGWTGSSTEKTWEGDASSSVSFSGDIVGMGMYDVTIVFTIEE